MPTYTIFAGVNGCGKTSIYKSVYYEENKDEKRINTDEMVARVGSWKDRYFLYYLILVINSSSYNLYDIKSIFS